MTHASRPLPSRRPRRAMSQIYILICFGLLVGLCAFPVGLGRVQLAKPHLHPAADTAARYAVRGILPIPPPLPTAIANPPAPVPQARVDGAPPPLSSTDVIRGT